MNIKKCLLIAWAAFILASPASAQIDSVFVEWDTSTVSYEVVLDSIFEHVNLDSMKTNYLLEKGFVLQDPMHYDGTINDSNTVNRFDLQHLYYSLWFSRQNDIGSIPNYDNVESTIETHLLTNAMPISVMSMVYDRVDTMGFYDGRLFLHQNRYIHSGANPASPFLQKTMVAAAPARNVMPDSIVTFIIPSNLVFQNEPGKTLTHLSIDFDNGQGPVIVNFNTPIQINYTNAGTKHLVYTCHYSDQSTRQCHGYIFLELNKFKYTDDVSTPINGLLPGTVWPVTANESFNGEYGSASVTVSYGCGNTRVLKPLIVAPGIDHPQYLELTGKQQETYQSFLSGWLDNAVSGSNILRQMLENEGYDLIYVDYTNGADYIERNAKVLKSVIRKVNDELVAAGSDEPITLLGISMGELVARRALVEMEADQETHNVETFISFDSPHRGAYSPIGLQEMSKHLANARFFGKRIRKMSDKVQLAIDVLENPATNQLLLFHTEHTQNDIAGPDPLRVQLQNEMDNFGFPVQVSPRGVQIRNLAITNGSGNGTQRTDISPSNRMLTVFLFGLPIPLPESQGIMVLPLNAITIALGTGILSNIKVWATPTNGDLGSVYHGDLIIFILGIPATTAVKTVSVKSGLCMECLPGGSGSIKPETEPPVPGITINNPNFTFIPSISGVSVNPPYWNAYMLDLLANFNPVTETWSNNQSSMDNFESADNNVLNEVHKSWSPNKTKFFIDHIMSEFRYERINGSGQLSPITTLFSNEEYNFGQGTTDRIGSTTINGGAVLSINKNIEVGYHSSTFSNFGDIPTNGSDFTLRSNGASCGNVSISVHTGGVLEIGDESTANTSTLILTNASSLNVAGGVVDIADNSELIIEQGGSINMNGGGMITLKDHSELIIEDGGDIEMWSSSNIIIEGNAILRIKSGGALDINGSGTISVKNNGKLIIEEGGELFLSQFHAIELAGANAIIELRGQIKLGSNATFSMSKGGASQNGYVHVFMDFDDNRQPFVANGSNCVISISGNNKHDLGMIIQDGKWTVPDNFGNLNLEDCKIIYTNNSTLRVECALSADGVKFEEAYPSAINTQGLETYGQANVTVTNCEFRNLSIVGWKAMNTDGGNAPTHEFNYFVDCETGMHYEGEGLNANHLFFRNCDHGLVTMSLAENSSLENGYFIDCGNGIVMYNSHNLDFYIEGYQFRSNDIGISIEFPTTPGIVRTTISCTNFIENDIALSMGEGHLNLSTNTTFNSNTGGNCTFIDNEESIKLHGRGLYIGQGNNNFVNTGANPYKFIQGSVENNSLVSGNLPAANNFWDPAPANIFTAGPNYYNITTPAFPNPVTVLLSGAKLPTFNDLCYSTTAEWETEGPMKRTENEEEESLEEELGNNKDRLHIYPNPVGPEQDLVIAYQSGEDVSYSLEIFDMSGKTIVNEKGIFLSGKNEMRIPLKNQAKGLYYIVLNTGGQTSTKKILKN